MHSANWLGAPKSTCEGSLFLRPHTVWEILFVSGSYHSGVSPESVWRYDFLNLPTSTVKLSQDIGVQFAEYIPSFDAAMSLSAGAMRFPNSAIYRSTGSALTKSDTKYAVEYLTNLTFGWSDCETNHTQLGYPDAVPQANFLADARTISAPSREKTRCPAHLQPHKPQLKQNYD